MGASGKSLFGHGARRRGRSPAASVSDGGYGSPPHPRRIRPGQRFSSRRGRNHDAIVVRRITASGVVSACRGEERVTVSTARLAQTRPDGQGEHYQFLGWKPGRYLTWATVVTDGPSLATLALPDWHPERPVRFPSRLLPDGARRSGAWLRVRADLSASSAARLNLVPLAPCDDPGAEACRRPGARLCAVVAGGCGAVCAGRVDGQ
jgi:hypothetical protein